VPGESAPGWGTTRVKQLDPGIEKFADIAVYPIRHGSRWHFQRLRSLDLLKTNKVTPYVSLAQSRSRVFTAPTPQECRVH
jgi:hypothetical protein